METTTIILDVIIAILVFLIILFSKSIFKIKREFDEIRGLISSLETKTMLLNFMSKELMYNCLAALNDFNSQSKKKTSSKKQNTVKKTNVRKAKWTD